MNVSLTGIPLGEWRDLTDDELIDLFKLIENSSSEAKPKAKAKPKTAGIKRPVVAMEKPARSLPVRRRTANALLRLGVKRKGVSVCRALAYLPTRKRGFRIRFVSLLFLELAGFLSLGFALEH